MNSGHTVLKMVPKFAVMLVGSVLASFCSLVKGKRTTCSKVEAGAAGNPQVSINVRESVVESPQRVVGSSFPRIKSRLQKISPGFGFFFASFSGN